VVSPAYTIDDESITEPLSAVAFSTDQRTLLTAYPLSRTVVRWDLDREGWIRRICAQVNRNLSKLEWDKYMDGSRYHDTCPGNPPGGAPR
jgi:hypothetical protein